MLSDDFYLAVCFHVNTCPTGCEIRSCALPALPVKHDAAQSGCSVPMALIVVGESAPRFTLHAWRHPQFRQMRVWAIKLHNLDYPYNYVASGVRLEPRLGYKIMGLHQAELPLPKPYLHLDLDKRRKIARCRSGVGSGKSGSSGPGGHQAGL